MAIRLLRSSNTARTKNKPFRLLYALIAGFLVHTDVMSIEERTTVRQKRNLTVEDTVVMTGVIDPFPGESLYKPPTFKFAADGRHFAIVTQKGNLKTGYNDAEILLFNTDEVARFVNSDDDRRKMNARVIARFSSSSNSKAIRQLRWLPDNQTIAFIGEIPSEPSQVYFVDIFSGKIDQITRHQRSVEYFAVESNSGHVLYVSTIKNFNRKWVVPYFVVGTQTIHELMSRNQSYPGRFSTEVLQYYSCPVYSCGSGKKVLSPFFVSGGLNEYLPFNIWLSPNGNRAVVSTQSDAAQERVWKDTYEPLLNSPIYAGSSTEYDENTMAAKSGFFKQFSIINLETGELEKTIQAPIGTNIGGIYSKAIWDADSQRVVLANTFLPLDSGNNENNLRKQAPAIVEYDLSTKKLNRITPIPVPVGKSLATSLFLDMHLLADNILLTKWSKPDGEPLSDRYFTRSDHRWIETRKASIALHSKNQFFRVPRLELSVMETLNQAPDILARDPATDTTRLVTDLNPHFRTVRFGKVKEFSWTDRSNRNWTGGLVYPPNYVSERRYPLVIQTNGFYPDRFLLTSPLTNLNTSAYAAQTLANKDILVLQVPNVWTSERDQELKVHRIGIESAIDTLKESGMIDVGKIGLLGFSRSGYYVQDLITFSAHSFAAGIVSDGSNISMNALSAFFGYPRGMSHIERVIGAVPWGSDLETWVSKNPNLHIDRVKTPLRIEHNAAYMPLWWSTYTMMRRLQKPAELVMYPKGVHNLRRPFEQVASQQGTVDWFVFWLKEEEDPNPAKAGQYERWRKLRDLQKVSQSSAEAVRKEN